METSPLPNAADHAKMVKGIFESFSKCSEENKSTLANEALNHVFSECGYSLENFFRDFPIPKKTKDSFLSALLYGLYYSELSPLLFPQEAIKIRWLLFQALADHIDNGSLTELLRKLSWEELLSLLVFCLERPREGSYKIFNVIDSSIFDPTLKLISKALLSHYYILNDVKNELKSQSHSLLTIYNALEDRSKERVRLIREILPKLIASIIAAPMKGFEMFNQMIGVDQEEPESVKQQREALKKTERELYELFVPYLKHEFSLEVLIPFFKTYGLYGYVGEGYEAFGGNDPFDEEINNLLILFEKPGLLPLDIIQPLIHFVQSFCCALEAYCYKPEKYVAGLTKIVYAMPTRGDDLENKQWLSSVVIGLDSLVSFLGFEASDISIVIVDQALPAQWEINHKFVENLAKKANFTIWHLSSQQTLMLAERLGASSWLVTTSKGEFGYGGSRNAIMFLAPVLHAAAKKGIRSIEGVMALTDSELKGFERDTVIYMGDDDLYIPVCNFYSDSLFAGMHQSEYFNRRSMYAGRATSDVHVLVDSKSMSENPSYLYESTGWTNQPLPGAMKGLITKPTFCLPIPFGSEEAHVTTTKSYLTNFEQPVIHLSGTRFPKALYPCTPYEGILSYLESYVPYVFGIIIVQALIDPSNKSDRQILSWNKPQMKYPDGPIHNFEDLLEYSLKEEVVENIRKSFFGNLVKEFSGDVEQSSIRKFCTRFLHVEANEAFPSDLKLYYKAVAEDASLALKYGEVVAGCYQSGQKDFLTKAKQQLEKTIGKPLTDFPLTNALVVLCEHFS